MKETKAVEIEIPKGIEFKIEGHTANFKGPAGEVKKKLFGPGIKIDVKDNKILIKPSKSGKKEKKLIGTIKAHINNCIKGTSEKHKYSLKICSGHFPMKVAVEADKLVVNNFIGEKFPRTLKLRKNVEVKVEGDIINVESSDKELAGQTAADIETLTKRTKYDNRIFQDGIYIINKDGKEIK